jgi:hypothetical protein
MSCKRRYSARTLVLLVSFLGISITLWPTNASCGDVLAYIGEENGNFDLIDLNTGVSTVLGNAGQVYTGLAFGPGNVIYGTVAPSLASNASLVTVNPSTGGDTLVGATGGTVSTFTNLADHTLYGVGYTNSNLYSFNPATGAATLIGATGLLSNSQGIGNSLASDGTHLFYTSYVSASDPTSILYELNLTTGAATEIGSTGVEGIIGSVFAGPTFQQGQLYGFLSNGDIDSINTTTGQATFVSNSGLTDISGGVGIVTSALVPEPASLTMALVPVAAALLHCVRRRLARPNRV